MLSSRDSVVKLALLSLMEKQTLVRIPAALWYPLAYQRRHQALTALVVLGAAAKPAVPRLLDLSHSRDRSISEAARYTLKAITSDAVATTINQ